MKQWVLFAAGAARVRTLEVPMLEWTLSVAAVIVIVMIARHATKSQPAPRSPLDEVGLREGQAYMYVKVRASHRSSVGPVTYLVLKDAADQQFELLLDPERVSLGIDLRDPPGFVRTKEFVPGVATLLPAASFKDIDPDAPPEAICAPASERVPAPAGA